MAKRSLSLQQAASDYETLKATVGVAIVDALIPVLGIESITVKNISHLAVLGAHLETSIGSNISAKDWITYLNHYSAVIKKALGVKKPQITTTSVAQNASQDVYEDMQSSGGVSSTQRGHEKSSSTRSFEVEKKGFEGTRPDGNGKNHTTHHQGKQDLPSAKDEILEESDQT